MIPRACVRLTFIDVRYLMSVPRLHTRLCDLVGVPYPIVQTGMGWVAGPRLVVATANAGGLGILAAATLTFDEMVGAIEQVQQDTDAPFGVNLRADAEDIDFRVEHLVRSEVRVASFAQAPGQATVNRLKDGGVVVIPTIGARRHAEKVQELGVDAVIAQGAEGGGHTGVVPTSVLVSQVADVVDVPVIAAGGFVDGRGLAAALALGADGIAMGTRFLLTAESTVPDVIKEKYLKTPVNGTVVTTAIDGIPQRVIATEVIRRLERASLMRFPRALMNALRFRRITTISLRELFTEGLRMKKTQNLTWSQVALAANAPMLTRAAMVDGHVEIGIFPTGQGVGIIDELPSVADLIPRIVAEASDVLSHLSEI